MAQNLTTKSNRSAGPLVLVLVVAALLRLFFLVAVPADEKNREAVFVGYNDEPAHYNYVEYLAENRRFPVQTSRIGDADAFLNYTFEYHQPPLYYLCAIPFRHVADLLCDGCGLYGVRLFSVLLSLALLLILHRFIRRYVRIPEAELGIPLFFGLLLGHARFSAQANNDTLLWLLGLMLFYLLFETLEEKDSIRDWAILGVIAGLGMLTKVSFLTLLAGPPVALLICRRDRGAVIRLGLFYAVTFLLAGPWMMRNQLVYSEWLATSVAIGDPRESFDAAHMLRVQTYNLVMLPFQFWSGFETTFSSATQQFVIKFLMLTGLGAGIVAARQWFLRRREDAWPAERKYFWGLLIGSVGNLAGFGYYGFRYAQGEVRMLFPSLLGLAYLVLVPLYRSLPVAQQRKLTWGIALATLLPWIGFF